MPSEQLREVSADTLVSTSIAYVSVFGQRFSSFISSREALAIVTCFLRKSVLRTGACADVAGWPCQEALLSQGYPLFGFNDGMNLCSFNEHREGRERTLDVDVVECCFLSAPCTS